MKKIEYKNIDKADRDKLEELIAKVAQDSFKKGLDAGDARTKERISNGIENSRTQISGLAGIGNGVLVVELLQEVVTGERDYVVTAKSVEKIEVDAIKNIIRGVAPVEPSSKVYFGCAGCMVESGSEGDYNYCHRCESYKYFGWLEDSGEEDE